LGHVSSSLEWLSIDYAAHTDFKPPQLPPRITLGPVDLRHMTALKVIRVSIAALLGWRIENSAKLRQVLPPSLVHLVISRALTMTWNPRLGYQWTPELILKTLLEFVEQEEWREVTPRLQIIVINDSAWRGWRDHIRRSYGEKTRRIVEDAGLQYGRDPSVEDRRAPQTKSNLLLRHLA
jgi:thiosulfate reductase cytochrome b subunit